MTLAAISEIREQLEQRKSELLSRLESVKRDVTSEHSADWSEQAQERQNDEVIQAIGNESREELNKVSIALERIASDEYDTCSQCGGDIALERLKAVPYTSLCIECASNKD
jgi:RNA polymerase-binding transcription factor